MGETTERGKNSSSHSIGHREDLAILGFRSIVEMGGKMRREMNRPKVSGTKRCTSPTINH